MSRLTRPEDLQICVDALVADDPAMGRAVKLAGRPRMRARPAGFPALLQIMTEQQLSVASAKAIWQRVEAGLGEVTPRALLRRSQAELRAMGLSGQKIRYGRDLAEAVETRRLDLNALHDMPEEEAIAMLTAAKGIGRWTAEIYLLFGLGRPDILPGGDLALQAAFQHLHALEQRPAERQLREVGEVWRPHRSAASLVLWTYYRHVRGLPPAGPDDKA